MTIFREIRHRRIEKITKSKNNLIFFKIYLDKQKRKWYNMQVRQTYDLGVAQLVARYLGVVEAASSSLVTQTISSVHNRFQLWTLDIFMSAFIFRCLE